MMCTKYSKNEEKQCIGAVTVKQICVYIGVSRATAKSPHLIWLYIRHIQYVQLISQVIKICMKN
jgi:hypothetical protein